MSTVIWNRGIFYADTQRSSHNDDGSFKSSSTGHKIHKGFGVIYATVGSQKGFMEFIHYGIEGLNPKNWRIGTNDSTTIWEWNGKHLTQWDWTGFKFPLSKHYFYKYIKKVWQPLESNWITAGSGGDYAAEGLRKGMTPREAIIYASEKDDFTNNKVDELTLDGWVRCQQTDENSKEEK